MIKYWIKMMSIFVLVAMGPAAWQLYYMSSLKESPRASAGVLDLSQWDFYKTGSVLLQGEWEFYPNQWVAPGRLDLTGSMEKQGAADGGFIQVPQKWDARFVENGKPVPFGYGTYRLVVKLGNAQEHLYGLRTGNIRMAHRLFLNGQEVGASGAPGASSKEETAGNIPYAVFVPVHSGTVEIIVQASNFMYGAGGGMVTPIQFGDQQSIMKSRELAVLVDMLTAAGLLIPGLYFLLLYRIRRNDRAVLDLACFCLFSVLYILSHGEKLLAVVWQGLPLDHVMLRVQLLSSTCAYLFLHRYVAVTVPSCVRPAVIRLFMWTGLFLLASGILLPEVIFTSWEKLILVFGFASVIYTMHVLLTGVIRRTAVSGFWLLVSFGSIMLFIILNFLYVIGIHLAPAMMMIEILLFVLAQAMIQAKRSAQSFNEVEALSHRLLTLDGLKDEFMANTSHELRTPLHGIINMAQAMMEGAAGQLNTNQQQHLALLVSTGKRLSLLINDIADFAKLKNGEILLNRHAVDFRMVAYSVLEVIRHVAAKREVRFVKEWVEDLPLMDTDEERLQQILYNLLGNAVKFTPQGEIRIKAEACGAYIKVAVSDTGIGIAKERLEDIFKAFDQGGSAYNREYHGTGLGLSITKKLIELNGGKLWVESKLGHGSTFYFKLPAASGPVRKHAERQTAVAEEIWTDRAAEADEFEAEEDSSRGRVLMIDDDPVNLRVLRSLLSIEQYEIAAFDNGIDALEALFAGMDADVVVTDWMMPGMTGLELCKEIRGRFSLSELPILMLTARSRPEDIELGFQAGVNDYLRKPVDAGELRSRVRTLMELRRSVQYSIRTETAFLQAQIKPHFLYNALNTIIAICPDDADQAIRLLLELSQYLRGSFGFQNLDRLIPLSKELELVKAYLHLEQARFDERLKYRFDMDESVQTLVPPLSIQPIVENAVRHGLMRKPDGGTVIVKLHQTTDGFTVSVQDDGEGIPAHKLDSILSDNARGDSVGLINIHKRLITLYGKGLQVESWPGRGTTVSFTVPRRLPAASDQRTRGDEG